MEDRAHRQGLPSFHSIEVLKPTLEHKGLRKFGDLEILFVSRQKNYTFVLSQIHQNFFVQI